MFGMLEVDVTKPRLLLRQLKSHAGESLSFTGFLLVCLSRALQANLQLQAYRHWGDRLVTFEDVDVALAIEIDIQDRKFPLFHVLRAVNRKTLQDIHDEIRMVQADPTSSLNFSFQKQVWMRVFLRLPGFIRRFIYSVGLRNAHWRRRLAGTVAVSAVGMFIGGGGWGVGLPNHSLAVTVGGISAKPGMVGGSLAIREYLDLTVSFDHEIVDGASAARFLRQFRELIESGYGLEGEETTPVEI